MESPCKRRADLTFRASANTDFDYSNGKLLSTSEAFERQKTSKDYFLCGTLVKSYGLVIAKSDYWNYKEDPGAVRKVIHLKDTSKHGKDKVFRTTLLGSYAQDFEHLKAAEGEYVCMLNPLVIKRRKIPFDDELDESFEVVVGYKDYSSKIGLHKAMPDFEKQPAPSAPQTDMMVTTIDMQPKRPLAVNGKSKTYTLLKDCVAKTGMRYNTWGIITKISRWPSQTNGRKIMATVYIEDPESMGTFGQKDYQLSLLGDNFAEFPKLVLHAVVRVHHLIIQDYQGQPTGRVYSARSVTVIPGEVNTPIQPLSTAKELEFTDQDVEKVKELREWWKSEQKKRGAADTNGVSQSLAKTLSHLEIGHSHDLFCQIVNVRENNSSIDVTDGTLCPIALLKSDGSLQASCKIVTIFMMNDNISNEDRVILRENDFVQLKDVQCVPYQNGYKMTCKFTLNDVHLLGMDHTEVKQIQGRLNPGGSGIGQVAESQQIHIGEDTFNAMVVPMTSQDWNPKNITATPASIIYPANMEELELQALPPTQSSSELQPLPPTQSSSSTSMVTAASQLDTQSTFSTPMSTMMQLASQEYHTCPDDQSERFSPSPEREMGACIETQTNYPWCSILELTSGGTNSNYIRMKCYITKIPDLKQNWKQNLVFICSSCCKTTKYEQRKVKCPECKINRRIHFHFVFEISDLQPRTFSQQSSTLDVYLAGYFASNLLQESPENYCDSKEAREEVHRKISSILNSPVNISICQMNDESDNGIAYQIIDSYFIDKTTSANLTVSTIYN